MKRKKIVANIKRNTPKLLLITVVLFALAIYRNSLFGDVLRRDNAVLLENLQEVADKFYGERVVLKERDNVLFEVNNSSGGVVGTVAWSYEFAKESKGYAGATPIAIFMDEGGLVQGVALLRNNETKKFVSRITARGFFESWNGQKISDIKEQPQAISGATLTTNSVIANFQQTQAYLTKTEHKTPLDLYNLLGQLAVLGVLILSLVVCFLPARTRWLRIPVLLLSVGVLGVWQGAFVSVELIYKWFVYGTSFTERFGLIIVVVTAFVVPFIFGRAQYCTYLCPFGAAQELVGMLNKRKLAIPVLVLKIFRYVRWGVLVVLTAVVALNPFFELSEVEPFTIFLINSAATSVVVIAAVSIVASIFFQRPWCRLLCPTGELLRN